MFHKEMKLNKKKKSQKGGSYISSFKWWFLFLLYSYESKKNGLEVPISQILSLPYMAFD